MEASLNMAGTYKIKIICGNCATSHVYIVQRNIKIIEAELTCPNCECDPTDENFVILTKQKTHGTATRKQEEEL